MNVKSLIRRNYNKQPEVDLSIRWHRSISKNGYKTLAISIRPNWLFVPEWTLSSGSLFTMTKSSFWSMIDDWNSLILEGGIFKSDLSFKSFLISPERIVEKEVEREKNIIDGWTYQLDSDGNVMKDSLGNDIKIDKIVTISAKTIEFFQSKSATVLAEVRYLDSQKNIIDKFPLDSEFWFRNIYLEFWGDIRALTKGEIKLSKKSFIPFPSDEILIYNNSENIKRKLKSIIKSFRWKIQLKLLTRKQNMNTF
mgnify:CR=1 FL=1